MRVPAIAATAATCALVFGTLASPAYGDEAPNTPAHTLPPHTNQAATNQVPQGEGTEPNQSDTPDPSDTAATATNPDQPINIGQLIQGLSSGPLIDHLGRPTAPVLDAMRLIAAQPQMGLREKAMISAAIGFIEGKGEPGAEIPDNAPRIAQFAWPTIAGQCIDGKTKAMGSAIAVPGPAALPLPGVPVEHTGFVFTALGTPGAAKDQPKAMTVYWMNLATGKTGAVALEVNGINPDGPATVNGTAKTGQGPIAALATGTVSTHNTTGGDDVHCAFAPTPAFFHV